MGNLRIRNPNWIRRRSQRWPIVLVYAEEGGQFSSDTSQYAVMLWIASMWKTIHKLSKIAVCKNHNFFCPWFITLTYITLLIMLEKAIKG